MKNDLCRFLFFICLANFGFFSLSAEEPLPITTTTDLTLIAATTLESKVIISETITVPFLVGESPFTARNNIRFKIGAEVSPVSLNGTFETIWTPVAFLQLLCGASVGSGWNIPIADGLLMNNPVGLHDSILSGGPFLGVVWSVKGGAVFQFDYAAINDGDWNHFVFRMYHGIQYRALSSASDTDSWLFEADAGENRNGFSYYGNYFLGYKMPLNLDTVGLFVEDNTYLFETPGRSFWGDDLSRWIFGPLANYSFNEKISAAVLVQWHTVRNFTTQTQSYQFYQDREIVAGNPLRIEFYRAAVNIAIKLK